MKPHTIELTLCGDTAPSKVHLPYAGCPLGAVKTGGHGYQRWRACHVPTARWLGGGTDYAATRAALFRVISLAHPEHSAWRSNDPTGVGYACIRTWVDAWRGRADVTQPRDLASV